MNQFKVKNTSRNFTLIISLASLLLISFGEAGCLSLNSPPPYISEYQYENHSVFKNDYYDDQMCENDPFCAIFFTLLSIPATWQEGITCVGQISDENQSPIMNSILVFKRRDWNGKWKISVLSPNNKGNFSFHIDPGSREWEVAILGEKLGGIRKIFGQSMYCPSLNFIVRVLQDPEEITLYRDKQLAPYIRSLIAQNAENISENDKQRLLNLLNK